MDIKDDLVIETSIFNHLASKIFIFVCQILTVFAPGTLGKQPDTYLTLRAFHVQFTKQ